MSELSRNNKWLVIKPTVVLTPIIDEQLVLMDKEFEKAKLVAYCTSGLRNEEAQLKTIRNYLTSKGLAAKYPAAMTCKVTDKLPDGTYVWQMAWSNLLNIKVIINPPIAAKCLMDYFNSKGQNRKGAVINQTPHASGIAYNIGGSGNGVTDEAAVIQKAFAAKIPGLLSFLVERENNAVHCNCYKIK